MKKLNFKKLIALGLTAAAAVASFTACSTNATSGGSDGRWDGQDPLHPDAG